MPGVEELRVDVGGGEEVAADDEDLGRDVTEAESASHHNNAWMERRNRRAHRDEGGFVASTLPKS